MTNEATPRPHDNRVVRLPLHDPATGMQLPGFLEVDVIFFTSSIKGLRASQARIVEGEEVTYPDPTPEQEIDMIDRIISGLPARAVKPKPELPDEYYAPANTQGVYSYAKGKPGYLLDVNSLYPEEIHIWRRIPEFQDYEINPLGVIRNRWTQRVIEVTEDGDQHYVAMHDKDGFEHVINVSFAMEKVYGKK